jgi:hypothetical protein
VNGAKIVRFDELLQLLDEVYSSWVAGSHFVSLSLDLRARLLGSCPWSAGEQLSELVKVDGRKVIAGKECVLFIAVTMTRLA